MILGVNTSSEAKPCYLETSKNDFLLFWFTDTEKSPKKSLKHRCRAQCQTGLEMKIELEPKHCYQAEALFDLYY